MVIAIALAIASVTAIVIIIGVAVICRRIPRLTLSRGCVEAALGIIKKSPAPLQ